MTSAADTAIARAIAEGAARALAKRAAALRKQAAGLTTTFVHDDGRRVVISTPEASTAIGTARLFEEAAADVAALAGRAA